MDLLAMVGMTFVSLAVLGYPLVSGRQRGVSVGGEGGDLDERKAVVYRDIKDLEFDREMEKVSEPEYAAMRSDYEGEAVRILEAMDRNEQAAQALCPACEETIHADSRFCPFCGEPLVKMCPACGASVGKQDRFCGSCRHTISHAIDGGGNSR